MTNHQSVSLQSLQRKRPIPQQPQGRKSQDDSSSSTTTSIQRQRRKNNSITPYCCSMVLLILSCCCVQASSNTFLDRFNTPQTCLWLAGRPLELPLYCTISEAYTVCPELCQPDTPNCTKDDDMTSSIDQQYPERTCAWLNFSMQIDYEYQHSIYCQNEGAARTLCPRVCRLCGDETDSPTASPVYAPPVASPVAVPTSSNSGNDYIQQSMTPSIATIDAGAYEPAPSAPLHVMTFQPDAACSICGQGRRVTAPFGTSFLIPNDGESKDCHQWETGGLMGALPDCDGFVSLVEEACMCAPFESAAPVTVPPVTPEPYYDQPSSLYYDAGPPTSDAPSRGPTPPTPVPTPNPTPDPTPLPTPNPTPDPTPLPTPNPTPDPTPAPPSPSAAPTSQFVEGGALTNPPSKNPSRAPTPFSYDGSSIRQSIRTTFGLSFCHSHRGTLGLCHSSGKADAIQHFDGFGQCRLLESSCCAGMATHYIGYNSK